MAVALDQPLGAPLPGALIEGRLLDFKLAVACGVIIFRGIGDSLHVYRVGSLVTRINGPSLRVVGVRAELEG